MRESQYQLSSYHEHAETKEIMHSFVDAYLMVISLFYLLDSNKFGSEPDYYQSKHIYQLNHTHCYNKKVHSFTYLDSHHDAIGNDDHANSDTVTVPTFLDSITDSLHRKDGS